MLFFVRRRSRLFCGGAAKYFPFFTKETVTPGETWFMGLKLKADRRALIPRFDTEVLCEAAIRDIQGLTNPRVLEIGRAHV